MPRFRRHPLLVAFVIAATVFSAWTALAGVYTSGMTVTRVSAATQLTDAATVTIDVSTNDSFYVTLGGNRTIAISNISSGAAMMLEVIQDGTGSRTLTWPAALHWASGTAPTLTTTAGKSDLVSCKSFNGTSMLCVANTSFTP